MSVQYTVDDASLDGDNELPWLACLECARPVSPPFVLWHGIRQLLFHPECAARIGAHLIADAREATLAGDAGPHWRRRLVGAVRHRLMAEELVA